MSIYQSIKKARKLLRLTQTELAEAVNMEQKDISLLERGEKTFIPNIIIQYLYKNSIDLNSLYSDGGDVKFLEGADLQENENNIAAEDDLSYNKTDGLLQLLAKEVIVGINKNTSENSKKIDYIYQALTKAEFLVEYEKLSKKLNQKKNVPK